MHMNLMLPVFIVTFLFLYAIERAIFAFEVPDRVKPTKNAWLTSIPFLTYIVLSFIFVIEFSTADKNPNFVISLFGFFIGSIGISFRYRAVNAFRFNKQKWLSHVYPENINILVQGGPYKFVRHPYYLSVMLELCGLALFLNAFKTIGLVFLIQAPWLLKRIVVEEVELTRKFGNQYLLYKKQVPAIIPLKVRGRGR